MIPLLLAIAGPGTFYTGNQLMRLCQVEGSVCAGYIAGVSDELEADHVYLKTTVACAPADDTLGHEVEIVERYMVKHPEMLSRVATDVVVSALHDAYPCPAN